MLTIPLDIPCMCQCVVAGPDTGVGYWCTKFHRRMWHTCLCNCHLAMATHGHMLAPTNPNIFSTRHWLVLAWRTQHRASHLISECLAWCCLAYHLEVVPQGIPNLCSMLLPILLCIAETLSRIWRHRCSPGTSGRGVFVVVRPIFSPANIRLENFLRPSFTQGSRLR